MGISSFFTIKNEKLTSIMEAPYNLFFQMTVIYFLMILLDANINWVFRLGYYFMLGLIFYFSRFLKYSKNEYRVIYLILIVSFFSIYFVYLNYFNNFESSALVNYELLFLILGG